MATPNLESQVNSGMEILSFAWEPEEWNQYLADIRQGLPDYNPGRTYRRLAPYAGGVVAFGSLLFALDFPVLASFVLFIGGGVFASILRFTFGTEEYARWSRIRALQDKPPAVSITSTGVVAAGHARLWREKGRRLITATAGYDNGWAVLTFGFEAFFVRDTLRVALPKRLYDDAWLLARMLAEKTGARARQGPTSSCCRPA